MLSMFSAISCMFAQPYWYQITYIKLGCFTLFKTNMKGNQFVVFGSLRIWVESECVYVVLKPSLDKVLFNEFDISELHILHVYKLFCEPTFWNLQRAWLTLRH